LTTFAEHDRLPSESDGPTLQGPSVVALAPRTVVLFVTVAIGALLLLALLYSARHVLVQLVVAVVLALALEPIVKGFERRGLGRGAAAGLTFALAALGLIVFAYLLVAPLVDETRRLVDDAPSLVQQVTSGDGRLGFLETRFHVVERTRDLVQSNELPGTANRAMDVVGSAVQTGGAIFFVAFLTLFVQLGGRGWFDSFVQLTPERARPRVRRTGHGIAGAVGGYVAGNLLISVIAGSVTSLVLFALGVPYAIPLGLVVALFDLIPLVGATIGTIIVGAVALTEGFTTAVIAVVAMIVYQQIENHSLQQLVYHRTVQLPPLAIAVSVAAGAEAGGVIGALLGIPFAGALKVVGAELVAWRRGEDAPHPA
jgi:predicted PurR-regulated permease PerM